MDQNLTERRLQKFPKRTGIRVQDLSSICSKLDWLDPSAQAKAQTLLKIQIQDVEITFERWAKILRVSSSTLIRNLIACSDPKDIEAYRLLFGENRQYWKEVLGSDFSKINSILPRHSNLGKALKSLLDGKKKISAKSLSVIVPSHKKAIFNALFYELQQDGKKSKKENLVNFFVKSAGVVNPSEPDEIVDFLIDLAPSFGERLDFLDSLDIDALSVSTRRAILKSESSRSLLLAPAFNKIFRADPRIHKDSSESIQSLKTVADALKCVAEGKLNARVIHKVLNDSWCVARFLDDLSSSLLKCSRLNSWKTSRKLASMIETLPSSIELICLRFFSETYPKRMDALIGENKASRTLANNIGADNIIDALCNSNLNTKDIKRFVQIDAVRKAVIDRLSKINLSKINKPDFTPRDWDERASKFASNRILRLMAIANSAELIDEKLCNKIIKKISSLQTLHDCAFLKDPSALDALWKTGPHGAKIASKIMQQFRAIRESRELWLEKIPAETIVAIGDSLSQRDIGIALQSPRRNTLIRLFIEPIWRSENKVWVTYLKALKKNTVPLPHILKIYLGKHPDVLHEVFSFAPNSCLKLALDRLSFPQILSVAFKSKPVALAVEKKWSRRKLQSFIGWVQNVAENETDEVGNKIWAPQISAAYQCALAFGLQYSNYLVSLSKQVNREVKPENRGCCFDQLYFAYKLPKKSGGNRVITAPDEKLKSLQRAILAHGFAPIDKSPSATGFRKGTSIVSNALPHVGKQIVVNVDIEGFFPNTPQHLIRSASDQLLEGKMSDDAKILITELCGYKGALPTGAPTSPAIANIILAPADKALRTVCRRHRISYTRYADDLTFSGNGDVLKVLPFVRKVLNDFGYRLDKKKTNIFRKGRRQVVTGLVVNVKPNLAKPIRKRLRAAVHNRVNGKEMFWHDEPMTYSELMGRIAFLAQTQPNEAQALREKLEGAFDR
jgi:RNA-directed DNA polymerase